MGTQDKHEIKAEIVCVMSPLSEYVWFTCYVSFLEHLVTVCFHYVEKSSMDIQKIMYFYAPQKK